MPENPPGEANPLWSSFTVRETPSIIPPAGFVHLA